MFNKEEKEKLKKDFFNSQSSKLTDAEKDRIIDLIYSICEKSVDITIRARLEKKK